MRALLLAFVMLGLEASSADNRQNEEPTPLLAERCGSGYHGFHERGHPHPVGH